jgi:hypothetical protein
MLSYETRWMTRDEIVQSSYQAGLRLNALKERFGLLTPSQRQDRADPSGHGHDRQVDEITLLGEEETPPKTHI